MLPLFIFSFVFSFKFLVGLVAGFFLGYKFHDPIIKFSKKSYEKITNWWEKQKEGK